MKKAHLMTSVQCHACGMVAHLDRPTIMASEQEMMASAVEVHKASGRICTKPLFAILYANALVSNELIPGPKQVLNGNGAAPDTTIHLPKGKG